MRLAAITTAAMIGTASAVSAQDAHYWTFQYGPRASLLGGAVIGSVDDVSATFYNPGALSLAQDLTFALSANVLERSGVALEDGGGQGVDLGTSNTGFRPSLVAGTIKRGLFGGGILAYSALSRTRGSQDLEGIIGLSGADIPPVLDLEEFAGVVRFEGRFNDFWAGLTYAHALGQNFGLGVTWYGAFRSQRRRLTSIIETVETDLSGGSIIDVAGGKYSTIRTLFKLGAYGQAGPFAGGLTVTTPSIHISGSGQLGLNEATLLPDSAAQLALTVQTDLPAVYKSPLSVGAGGALRFGGTRIHGSGEWFQAIDPYVVIQGNDYVTQQPQVTREADAVHETAEVVNWGVGLEQAFSGKFSGYASFATDNSALDETIERAGLSTLPIDIKTVTAGLDVAVSRALFTFGVGYGWGEKVDEELTDIFQGTSEEFQATFVYRSLRLIFGFEVGLD